MCLNKYIKLINNGKKIVAENATKRNLHKTYARHNLKRYLYLTQKSGFVNTKSRKNVHKYLFGFYAYITYSFWTNMLIICLSVRT